MAHLSQPRGVQGRLRPSGRDDREQHDLLHGTRAPRDLDRLWKQHVTLANNTIRGGPIKYGGQHKVYPMELIQIKDDAWIVDGKIQPKP